MDLLSDPPAQESSERLLDENSASASMSGSNISAPISASASASVMSASASAPMAASASASTAETQIPQAKLAIANRLTIPVPMKCKQGHVLEFRSSPALHRDQCHNCRKNLYRRDVRYICKPCNFVACCDCTLLVDPEKRGAFPTLLGHEEEQSPRPEDSNGKCKCMADCGQVSRRAMIDFKQAAHRDMVCLCQEFDLAKVRYNEIRSFKHTRMSGRTVPEDCIHVPYTKETIQLQRPLLPAPPLVLPPSPDGDVEAGKRKRIPFALARSVYERVQLLLGIVRDEVKQGIDQLDPDWFPKLPLHEDGKPPASMVSFLLGGPEDMKDNLKLLAFGAKQVFEIQPTVTEVTAPVKVFGDIHGQFRDLLVLFHFYNGPSPLEDARGMSYIFNGDFVDRGYHQIETIILLFTLKILFPDRIFLNRGNHEEQSQNRAVSDANMKGFDKVLRYKLKSAKIGNEVWSAFAQTFEYMPMGCLIERKILVIHGGLGAGKWNIPDLQALQRPLNAQQLRESLNGDGFNVVWSDPIEQFVTRPPCNIGTCPSPRSSEASMVNFGKDVTEQFCFRNNIGLIIRSHQYNAFGTAHEISHDGFLMRIFSARNYSLNQENDGGLLLIAKSTNPETPDKLLVKAQAVQMKRCNPNSDDPTLWYNRMAPYCPRNHLMSWNRRDVDIATKAVRLFHTPSKIEAIKCAECDNVVNEDVSHFFCRSCCDYALCLDCASDRHRASVPRPELFQEEQQNEEEHQAEERAEEEAEEEKTEEEEKEKKKEEEADPLIEGEMEQAAPCCSLFSWLWG